MGSSTNVKIDPTQESSCLPPRLELWSWIGWCNRLGVHDHSSHVVSGGCSVTGRASLPAHPRPRLECHAALCVACLAEMWSSRLCWGWVWQGALTRFGLAKKTKNHTTVRGCPGRLSAGVAEPGARRVPGSGGYATLALLGGVRLPRFPSWGRGGSGCTIYKLFMAGRREGPPRQAFFARLC